MKAGDICNHHVVTVSPDDSIKRAAELMREHHVGDVVVAHRSGGFLTPLGILTDRDIVVEIIAKDSQPEGVSVGDVMSFDLLTVPEDLTVSETIELMRAKSVRRAPVVDAENGLVGIVTVDDLIGLVAKQLAEIFALIVREQRREAELRD